MMKRSPDPFWRNLAFCGGVNFAVFVVIALYLGGSAFGTSPSGGHYYLADHGHLTEVGRGVWIYSWAHAFLTVTTFPLVVIVAFIRQLMYGPGLDGRERGIRWPWRRL
ncbi:MAG TPA: hypothetical protein VN851_27965 [Thermoanaerobaculia bacterium]|nr:hypothetical protein [Thermoanaerobaculia bacterium]